MRRTPPAPAPFDARQTRQIDRWWRGRGGRARALALSVALTAGLQACDGDGLTPEARAPQSAATQADALWQPAAGASLLRTASDSWPPAAQSVVGNACSTRLEGSGRTLDLGPDREYTEAAAVPWLSLEPGDVVNVHHRTRPYRVKIALASRGRSDAPIVINGVTDGACNRPVISGADARIAADAADTGFFDPADTERLGTVLLHRRPTDAYGARPAHIVLRHLEIIGAHPDNAYTGQDGVQRHYLARAAGIHAGAVDDLVIENTVVHGNGNGVFVGSDDPAERSSHVVLRANAIYANGVAGSRLQHNVQVSARRALYEGNYLGQLIVGAEGASLKDRSSGTVVRYNRIDAAVRALDLVGVDAARADVRDDPLHADAWVYGNLIVNDLASDADSSASLVRWSHDLGPSTLRGGTLHWYHNTLITLGDRERYWYVALFDTPQLGERVAVRDSAFVHDGTAERYIVKDTGRIDVLGANYLGEGWLTARSPEADVQVEPPITVPGRPLEVDLRPMAGGPLVDTAGSLQLGGAITVGPASSLPIDAGVWRVSHQPAAPWGLEPRPVHGHAPDVGAFEVH